jgi:pimeloyl-ACP methyl ester carboxylesterase
MGRVLVLVWLCFAGLVDAAPEPPAPRRRRAWEVIRIALVIAAALVLVAGVGYTCYAAAVGSEAFLHPSDNPDCRTPSVRYGWDYEAINYDKADDARLQAANGTMENCSSQGAVAGTDVITSDGMHIAGWYIAAASGAGPTAPTVIVVHGFGANKSEAVKYAVPLHPTFNVVVMDLRGGGRSTRAEVTFGLREQLDLEAMIDWVERTKRSAHLAVVGISMGGATSVLAAVDDSRIEALILDSMHARVEDVVGRRLETEEGHPSIPGTPAILFGVWIRTGINVMDTNPINYVGRLGRRPVLFIHGTADEQDLPVRSVEANYATAIAAAVPTEMHMCEGGTHGHLIDTCPADWARWSVDFLNRAFGTGS